ncbi:uncharacterized protein LOC141911027 [Tubulanus polymorphus]|uniref:uncharacterized protein LOC141911027 n=1 Tax=Tubulanus polymorphus TaxID=672921 RepID=UPI003DA500DD
MNNRTVQAMGATTEHIIRWNVTSVFFIIGVGGNFLLLVVLLKTRRLRKAHYKYVMNATFANVLALLTNTIHSYVQLSMPTTLHACQVMTLLTLIPCYVSTISVAAMAIHQYVKVCHPNVKVTKTAVLISLVVVWAVPLIAYTSLEVGSGWDCFIHPYGNETTANDWTKVCTYRVNHDAEPRTKACGLTMVSVSVFLPTLIIGVLYALIRRKIYEDFLDARNRKGSTASTMSKPRASVSNFLDVKSTLSRRRRVIFTLTIIYVCFVCFTLPSAVTSFAAAFVDISTAKTRYASWILGLYFVLNWLLFVIVDHEIRKGYREFVSCWRRDGRNAGYDQQAASASPLTQDISSRRSGALSGADYNVVPHPGVTCTL